MTQILIKTFIFFCYKTPVEIFNFDSRSKKFLNDLNGFYECLIVLNVLNVCVSPVGKNFVTKRIFKMWQNSFLPILEFIPITLHYLNFCNPCHKSCHILQNQNVTKKIRSDVGFCCFVTFVTLFYRVNYRSVLYYPWHTVCFIYRIEHMFYF